MIFGRIQIIHAVLMGTLLATASCAPDTSVPVTTEFQARIKDAQATQKASQLFKLSSGSKQIHYKLFDYNGEFAKNNIVVRYRDKGPKIDFSIKIRFPYDIDMLTVLTQCFVDQKIEVNRYSDRKQEVVELVFKREVKKEDLGIINSTQLSQSQILAEFQDLQAHMKDQIAELISEYPEFSQIKESIQPKIQAHFENVSQKIKLVSKTPAYAWKNTSSFQRNKWTVASWMGYPEVVIEVMQSDQSNMEISTRVEGDIKNQSFFNDLRLSGLHI